MLSRRQILQSLGASAAGALVPSRGWAAIGSPLSRAQIVDFDFDATPYLTQLKNAGVKTIGRYYDRAYGTGIGEVCYHHKSKTLTKAELTEHTKATLKIQSKHEAIRKKAREIVGKEKDPVKVATRIARCRAAICTATRSSPSTRRPAS